MSSSLLGRLLLAIVVIGFAGRSEALPTVPAGYQVDEYLVGVGAATGIAIAPDGSLWVADYNGRILRSTSPRSFSVVASGVAFLEGVAFTASGRVFTVAAGSTNSVYEVVGGVLQPFASGLSAPTSIAGKGDELFVSNSSAGTISKVSLSGVVQTILAGVGNPYGVSFDSAGKMYFIDHAGGAVYSYDFAATPVRISSVTAYGGTFTGLGYGGRPFFTDVQTGYLYWLPAANSPSVFGTGFAGKASPPAIGPQGIAFDGQNVLFVGDGDRIWRIVGPMPTVNLSANSNRRTVGEAVALTWSSSGATSCGASGGAAADGWAGSKALAGSATLTESTPGTYTYVLLCTSAAGSTSAQTSVTFTLPSATLVANPAALTAGDMATLTWTSVDSTSCDATGGAPNDGWAGPKAANGSVSLTSATAGTYVYTIACTAGSQSSQAQVSITYTVPSVSLSPSPASVAVGQSTTLTWTSSSATSCTASGGSTGDGWAGPKALAGSAAVSFAAAGTYTYTIVCSAGSRSAQAQATVSVTKPSSGSSGGGGGGAAGPLALLLLAGGAARRRCSRITQ